MSKSHRLKYQVMRRWWGSYTHPTHYKYTILNVWTYPNPYHLDSHVNISLGIGSYVSIS